MHYTKIKTFEDACEALGIKPDHPDVSFLPSEFQEFLISTYRLAIIVRALNMLDDGTIWEPNWRDFSERKWSPWFDFSHSSGSIFLNGCDFEHTRSSVGSRLLYRKAEIAAYAATQFEQDYQNLFQPTKQQ